MPATAAPSRRSPAKHAAILDAAAALVAEQGYNPTTMEQVAARAGVGKQTLYRRWPNKAAMMTEVYTALVPAERLRRDRVGVHAAIRHMFTTLFRVFRETAAPHILSGLIAEAQADRVASRALREALLVGRRDLITIPLRRGVATGELAADFDVEAQTDLMIALIWHRLLTDPSGLTDDFAASLVARALGQDGEKAAMDITYDGYRPGDLGLICHLQSAYYAEVLGFDHRFEIKVAAEMAAFLSRFDADRHLFVVARAGGRPVGSVTLDAKPDGTARLRWFVVDVPLRGHGIGRRLLERAVAFARSRGYARIHLTTVEGLDAAAHLYQAVGFALERSAPGTTWGRSAVEQTYVMTLD